MKLILTSSDSHECEETQGIVCGWWRKFQTPISNWFPYNSLITNCTAAPHAEAKRMAQHYPPDTCCFLSCSCQIGCHPQLLSSLSKSCSLDSDSCRPCHIMYRRWWPHSHYSLQPPSLTLLWQHSNDMAVGGFDGTTISSPEREEDKQ